MSKLVWDVAGERLYETGTKNGVLYPQGVGGTYPEGVAWNGLIGVSENPSGAEPTKLYANDGIYVTLVSAEEFAATVEAYMYPDEFAQCDGSADVVEGFSVGQQTRKPFGFSYQTMIGSDTEGNNHGYKIHLIYGAIAAPTSKEYKSINDSPEANTFSWELSTTPVKVAGFKPTAYACIDSTKVSAEKLAALEEVLYGTTEDDARLPLPDEIATILGTEAP